MRFSTTQVEPGIRRLDHITPPQPGLQVVRASKISAMSNLPNLANIGRDISLGASGAEYTSPGNGYIGVMFKNSTACNLHSATVGINSVNFYQTTKLDRYAYIPILKGQKFNLFYDTAGSLAYFKFIPAQGEV